jgi:antitoxin component of MazEF toxin-antitoxin module
MTGTIQELDNRLTLRIPLAVAKQIHVQEGDPVVLKDGDSRIIVKAVPKRLNLERSALQNHSRKHAPNHRLGSISRNGGCASMKTKTQLLPTKVMAREYQLALPGAKKLEAELSATLEQSERSSRRTSEYTKPK